MNNYGFNQDEYNYLKTLNTPQKIQDFLDNLQYNWCTDKYVCKSPKRVLREKNAHCLEGALFAAAAQRLNGKEPLIIELVALKDDFHFISPYKSNGYWGAMAQSRNYILRWRDPIFKSIRELVLSYLQGYVIDGELILRKYTPPINISQFDSMEWMVTEKCLEELGNKFDDFPHHLLFENNHPLRKVPGVLESLLLMHKKI